MKTKIKDLPVSFDLVGAVLYIPKTHRPIECKLLSKMIIKSGWNKGFWCKRKLNEDRVFPITFYSFDEIKDWYVETIAFSKKAKAKL